MNGMKIPLTLVFAVVLQAVGLVWYVSKIDSKVETMWSDMQDLTDKMAIEENVKMKIDLQNLIADVGELQKDMKRMNQKDKEIVKQNRSIEKQHKDLFKLLRDGTTSSSGGYNYGD